MFKYVKKLISKRRMEKMSKIAEVNKYHSICYSCKKHNNCEFEDGIPIIRCPEYK